MNQGTKKANNYRAWEIDKSDFPESGNDIDKLVFLCGYAILAPSGHNSQPWQIQKNSASLVLKVNEGHYISGEKSGLLPVEPYVSLGTFIETFILAASGFGYKIKLALSSSNDEVARLSLGGKTQKNPAVLHGITNRVSNRNMYLTSPIKKRVIEEIDSESFDGVKVALISERTMVDDLATETENAISKIMSHISYRKELGEWVRNNITNKKDGMPGFTHGVKLFPSLIAKYGIIYASALGPPVSHSGNLIRNSSMLAIIGYETDSKLSHIAVGRKYANMTVRASMHGISSSALGAAVVDPETRERIVARLNLGYRPVVILRFGKSDVDSKHSPRWPVSEIVS